MISKNKKHRKTEIGNSKHDNIERALFSLILQTNMFKFNQLVCSIELSHFCCTDILLLKSKLFLYYKYKSIFLAYNIMELKKKKKRNKTSESSSKLHHVFFLL
jgi:hypothetical protein